MFGKERLCKIDKVRNNAVVPVRPKGGKFKAVARFPLFVALRLFFVMNVIETGTVGIVLRIRTVGDDKNLHILEQSAGSPKAVALVAFDLIERFPQFYPASFEFDMHERQTVDQNRNVVPRIVCAARFDILMHDLQLIVVDILFID